MKWPRFRRRSPEAQQQKKMRVWTAQEMPSFRTRVRAWVSEVRSGERRLLSLPWDVGSGPGHHGVSVEKALQLGPVYAAGRLLAGTISGLPLQTYRSAGDTRHRIPSPSLFMQPSVVGTTRDWVFRAITSICYQGNAVGLVTGRDYMQYPTMIEWIDPQRVHVIDSMLYGPGSFTNPLWYIDGQQVENREDIVHIPYFTLPGKIWGLSPIGAFAATVRTGVSAQEYQADWFENGGVPPGTFKSTSQMVDPEEANKIKKRLVQSIRSKEPIVYGRGWDYQPITIPAHEARFVETMRLNATQIAAIIGLPPELIGGETGGSMTYSSPEQRQIEFLQIYLLPWITLLESHLSALLPRGQYVKFNADAMVRTDMAGRYAAYKIARDIGLECVDEQRANEDKPPLPNGKGQDYTPLLVEVAKAMHPAPAAVEPTEPKPPSLPARGADWDAEFHRLVGERDDG